MLIQDIKSHLLSDQLKEAISDSILREFQQRSFSYETFGKDIEPCVINTVRQFFIEKGLNQSQIKIARNKNEFPDILLCGEDGSVAVDIKSGNHFKKTGDTWKECKNSNNDLGTINAWPEKIKKYGGENIYFIFIEYSMTEDITRLDNVSVAPFYKFLDINTNGVLKYREKDGNLRPKNFDVEPKLNTFEEFERLFKATEILRAKHLVIKHFKTLPQEQRQELFEELQSML